MSVLIVVFCQELPAFVEFPVRAMSLPMLKAAFFKDPAIFIIPKGRPVFFSVLEALFGLDGFTVPVIGDPGSMHLVEGIHLVDTGNGTILAPLHHHLGFIGPFFFALV